MKTNGLLTLIGAGVLLSGSAYAQGYVESLNFVITHDTSINQIGAYDGGVPLASDEFVGIFNDATGNLVGPYLEFGPDAQAAGITGEQIGKTYFENTSPFILSPGEYSIIATGSGSGNGGTTGLTGIGNSFSLDGTIYTLPPASGTQFQAPSYALHDPPINQSTVPDGGLTLVLLSGSLAGLGWLRRKI